MQECIKTYLKLSKDVFKLDQVLGGRFPTGDNACRFNYKDLENAIKEEVKERLGSEDFGMSKPTNKPGCRTFVVAKVAGDVTGPPELFRSYKAGGYSASPSAIWEAARATSAAPTYFKAMTIKEPEPAITYVDGGVGFNNPSQLARQEAARIWPASTSCTLVSIGTGHPRSVNILKESDLEKDVELQRTVLERVINFVPDLLNQVPLWRTMREFPVGVKAVIMMAGAMSTLVTDSENVHNQLWEASRVSNVDARFPYFRFNVERDVGDIGLGEWQRSPELGALSKTYLIKPDVVDRKMRCVRWLITSDTVPRK